MKIKIPANPFVLIDGSSYLFRAYYALPPLTNSKGIPTGAIYGFINMLQKLLSDYTPEKIAVVFDCKEKTFRNYLYPEYKANRTVMPDDLAIQIQYIHSIIQAMGIPLLAIPGFEADDILGTIATQANNHNIFTLISTGDKDLAQLVNKNTVLLNTMTNQILNEQAVLDKFKVRPDQIIDYLTLVGDSVDNIPGIPKVGPKTAVKWLELYKDLDGIIENKDNITGKIGENLCNNIDNLPMYKKLTTIDLNVKLPVQISDLIRQDVDQEKLIGLYAELEFKNKLQIINNRESNNSKINQEVKSKTNSKQNKQYKIIMTEADLDNLIVILNNLEIFSIDTETTSLNHINAELIGISIAIDVGVGFYIPVGHQVELLETKQLSLNVVLDKLSPILRNNNVSKIMHNAKYDLSVFLNYGLEIFGVIYDTMLESYVLNSTSTRHNLDDLSLKYLSHSNITYEDVTGKGVKQIPFSTVPIENAAEYAIEDADVTFQLHRYFYPKLISEPGLLKLFTFIEMPLVQVLLKMERNGVLISSEKLKQQSDELEKKMEKLQSSCFMLAGEQFNINSPKQLQKILYEKLELPILQKTPKGQPSTAEPVLQDLAKEYELPKDILEYRSLSKLKSTYTDKLPLDINSKTNRVHTTYQQAVTATGRLSSRSPNLQNIPIKTEEGKRIREAFIAPRGYKILSADYSQVELRIMAHLSQDKNLIKAFKEGKDIHTITASEIFETKLENVTKEQRRNAKAINFGLIYGMSAYGLSEQLNIARKQAQEYIDFYFARFPGVNIFMESVRENAKKSGYVETMFGRRLYLPDLNSNNHIKKSAAQRAAINAPMQGAQADIIKKAMIEIYMYLADKDYAKLLLQVHDELVFEVKAEKALDLENNIISLMSGVVNLSVPLEVSVGIEDNWAAAH